jgi:effector-binding domain-containing protein
MKTNRYITLVVILFLSGYVWSQDSDIDYRNLEHPAIIKMRERKMLVAETKGDPAGQTPTVIRLVMLHNTLTKDMTSADCPMTIRIFESAAGSPKDTICYWAFPVSEKINAIPNGSKDYPEFRIETWSSGEAAAVLHRGSYDGVSATAGKLKRFIKDSGYEVTGPLEQECIVGPGRNGPGVPADYITVIRFEVKKKQ